MREWRIALFVAFILAACALAIWWESRNESACEDRGGSWQPDPSSCHLACRRETSRGCVEWRQHCDNHCVGGRQ